VGLFAKEITPSDVYSQVDLIGQEVHFLLKHYGIAHNHDEIVNSVNIKTELLPRNVWQKTYEILLKINILRNHHKLPTIEPVAMTPVLHLNPNLVYEQTQRILTELKIFETRMALEAPRTTLVSFTNKKPSDVFKGLSHLSMAFDEITGVKSLNEMIFGENMRIYDDITLILDRLKIDDQTIPATRNPSSTIESLQVISLKTLEKIRQLQISSGINFIDFESFRKQNPTSSDILTTTEMIIAELQTIKAYLGITKITPAALTYNMKTPIEIEQIMSWNLRKLNLIRSLIGDTQ
jgi:hypothetical protein